MRVADLHCDLLWYLSLDPRRTAFDPESQSSLPLLSEGGVELQVFPIYTATAPGSTQEGERQFAIFDQLAPDHLKCRLAIENASGFCSEEESLEEGLNRLEAWLKKHPIQYISLTWNDENRFGGGAATRVGLKEDGKKLLAWMQGRKIAIDLSHASDVLAHDILKEIDALSIIPIASHSNFRAVCNHLRNLPDDIAQGIVKRGGVIGLNMVQHFLGKGPEEIISHLQHAEKLGIAQNLCLGADFFAEIDAEKAHVLMKPYFFENFSTSACYPRIANLLRQHFTEDFVENLMYRRLYSFLILES